MSPSRGSLFRTSKWSGLEEPNYWEYNPQQIFEGDVQTPQKGTSIPAPEYRKSPFKISINHDIFHGD